MCWAVSTAADLLRLVNHVLLLTAKGYVASSVVDPKLFYPEPYTSSVMFLNLTLSSFLHSEIPIIIEKLIFTKMISYIYKKNHKGMINLKCQVSS
jgi:hypothetical protein